MATGQKNISIGTADNAQDGITLREAFRRIRKNFAEIYGDTDSDNLTDTESVTETNFDSHITEKIQDVVGGMVTGNEENNITVTYQDSDGTLDFDVQADITDVNAGLGLTGENEGGGSATLNVGAGEGITVNDNDVALDSSVAGSGLTYTSGILSVNEIDTEGIGANAVTPPKMEKFDDALVATDGHILVADGNDFSNVAVTGVIDITNAGVTSFDSTVAGDGILNTSGVLSLDVDDSTVEVDDTNGLQIKDDGVNHDQLAARYTAVQSINNTSDITQNLDASSYSVFNFTADRIKDTTLNIQNMKTGQVIDIHGLSGDFTITLSSDDTAETFNQVGDGVYDGASDNHIQIVCIDDTNSAAIYNYVVGTYSSDTNPA